MAKTTKNNSQKETQKSNKSKRKIRTKNYLILISIYIVTLLLVLLLRTWYISYRDYQLTIPVLKGHLNEVTVAELDHYITANSETIIYIEVSEDENSREVAKQLIDVVKERNLVDKTVYLNLSSEEDKELFFEEFNNKYNTGNKNKLKNYPALILLIDGKIENFVSKTKKQDLNIGDIAQLFDEYELEGE